MAAVVALQEVKSEDQRELATLVSAAKANLYVFCCYCDCSRVLMGFGGIALTSMRSSAVCGVEDFVEISLPRC